MFDIWCSNPRLTDVTFSDKCTYKEKDWEDREGNHEFLMYVENQGGPGGGADDTWIEIHDKDGNAIAVMSEGRDAPYAGRLLQQVNRSLYPLFQVFQALALHRDENPSLAHALACPGHGWGLLYANLSLLAW